MRLCQRNNRVGAEPKKRHVHLNNAAANAENGYADNVVVTSKYTLLTFVPRNLFEQFHRIANVYFLVIAVLQQIPGISPLGRGTTAMTLAVVLSFTALKEALEDIRRHRNDAAVNATEVSVLRNGEMTALTWAEVVVGDVLFVRNGDYLPADLLVLSSSEPQGMCYIETSNLDGESNLKIRKAPPPTVDAIAPEFVSQLRGVVECDAPNAAMYVFDGQLSVSVPAPGGSVPITMQNVVLRGAQLRNTKWIYGLAVYTGKDTKIAKSSNRIPTKRSTVEKHTNKLIVIIFLGQLVLCFICALGNGLWLSSNKDKHTYLRAEAENAPTSGLLSFLTFLILFSNLIPISLYVSMETVKFGQSFFINADINMYFAPLDLPAVARTSNLNEELGQVKYIFSDKTGTLTRNSMDFKKLTVGGIAYGAGTHSVMVHTPRSYVADRRSSVAAARSAADNDPASDDVPEADVAAALEALGVEGAAADIGINTDGRPRLNSVVEMQSSASLSSSSSTSSTSSTTSSSTTSSSSALSSPTPGYEYTYSVTYEYEDEAELGDGSTVAAGPGEIRKIPSITIGEPVDPKVSRALNATPLGQRTTVPHCCFEDDGRLLRDLGDAEKHDVLFRYFTLLAVCHTVIPEVVEAGDGSEELLLQAASPDEGALVNAAKFCGFEFHSRTPTTVTVDILGTDQDFEVLYVNEFTSSRKRMSVVVRMPDGQIKVMVKGADMAILPLLDDRLTSNVETVRATDMHLNVFAHEALRTLMMAERTLTEAELSAFGRAYAAAQRAPRMEKRRAMANAAELVECELELLGASAIEDKLQDGVPQAIASLRQAGIHVWVLTGDKQETAIMIGYACSLLDDSMRIVIPSVANPDGEDEDTEELLMGGRDPVPVAQRKQWLRRSLVRHLRDMEQAIDGVEFGCVLDGRTLSFLLDDDGDVAARAAEEWHASDVCIEDQLRELLLSVTKRCKSVIGCRVSPAQKAQVVAFVQSSLEAGVVTLAIGDGANDVEMIKEARIGVGIAGEEGQQAAMTADYAVAQFRFLRQLLFVHGAWCYNRIAKLILYSFYKNITLALVPFWFVFDNGYSGQTFVEKWTFSLYNVVFTALPILVVGVFDRSMPRRRLLAHPELYRAGAANRHFSLRVFIGWMASAVGHSIVLYYGTRAVLGHNVTDGSGQSVGLFFNGIVTFTAVVLTVNVKLALETHAWTWMNAVALFLSIAGLFFWVTVYSYIVPPTDALDMLGVGPIVYSSPLFWLTILFFPVLALLPDTLFVYVRRTYFPEPYDIVLEMEKYFRLSAVVARTLAIIHQTSAMAFAFWPSSERRSAFVFDPAPPQHHLVVGDVNFPNSGRNRHRQRELLSSVSSKGSGDITLIVPELPPRRTGASDPTPAE